MILRTHTKDVNTVIAAGRKARSAINEREVTAETPERTVIIGASPVDTEMTARVTVTCQGVEDGTLKVARDATTEMIAGTATTIVSLNRKNPKSKKRTLANKT